MEYATQDRDEIIAWAERRSGHAAIVAGVHPQADTDVDPDIGALRIDFPGYAGLEQLEPLTWDDFFDAFYERGATFHYEDTLPNDTISYVYRIEAAPPTP